MTIYHFPYDCDFDGGLRGFEIHARSLQSAKKKLADLLNTIYSKEAESRRRKTPRPK